MKHQLIIFAIDNSYTCFHHDQKHWHLEKIEGEQWVSDANKSLANIIDIMKDRLDVKDFSAVEVQLIVDANATNQLSKGIDKLNAIVCQSFQILRWEAIKKRTQALSGKTVEQHDTDTLLTFVCPLVENTFHYQDEALQAERQRALLDHKTDIESIRKESIQLLHEKEALQAQINALKQPEMDYLVTFLPAIFENFFLHVAPQDLALLAGSLMIPSVQTPFTEPDAHTVQGLKKKLQNLPEASRQQVIDFAQQLPQRHKLKVRKEMQSFMEDD